MSNFNLKEAANAILGNLPTNKYLISPISFLRKVEAKSEMYIIDLRGEKEYSESHIQGAVNIPFNREFYQHVTEIPTDKKIIFYCYGGQLGAQAAALLTLLGISSRSVNYGWVGIKKMPEYTVFTTEPTTFEKHEQEYDQDALKAIKDYCDNAAHLNLMPCEILKEMIENEDDFYLMSIQSEEDYATEHIKGSILHPYRKGMNDRFSEIPKDKKVIVYCYSGQSSAHVTVALNLLGYDAYSLKYGIGVEMTKPVGWKNMGYELVAEE